MPKRQKLAIGVWQDPHGCSVIYQVNGLTIEKRFPRGTTLSRMVAYRTRQIQQAQDAAPPRGPVNALARDAVRYLKPLKGLPGYKSEKSHLKAWLHALGSTSRGQVTRDRCEAIVAQWRQDGYAARTIRHRVRVLTSLFRKFDGRGTLTPLEELRLPAKPKPRPMPVADAVIADVALQLRKHEIRGSLTDGKTRARFLVLATHAQRPAELQRAEPADVDLVRRLWFLRGAKGGYNTVVPLNDEQLAAWELFRLAQAWGMYDTRSFARTLRRAGWPTGIRPYNLRHSTGFALDARGVDLGDIQGLMGHTSPETTRAFYAPGLHHRLVAATRKLDGRFPAEVFALPSPALPSSTGADTKGQENARQLRRAKATLPSRGRRRDRRKVG